MKNTLLSLLAIFMIAACSEPLQEAENTVPPADTMVLSKKKAPAPVPMTVVYVDSTDWNITSDTSICGYLILRWTDQNRPVGASNYYFVTSPLGTGCSGGLFSTTNSLYYQYGWGCVFWTNSTYTVSIRYNWTDTANSKIFVYTSKAVTVKTGRGTWDCN